MERTNVRMRDGCDDSGGRSRSSRQKIRALSLRCPRVSNGVRKGTDKWTRGQRGRGHFLSGLRMSFQKRCECDRMDGWLERPPVASLALWPTSVVVG